MAGTAYVYENARQTVTSSAWATLTGTVTVQSLNSCSYGAAIVAMGLNDANMTELGSIVFSHHPNGCGTDYIAPSSRTAWNQNMPNWLAGRGAQPFTVDVASIIGSHLPGVDPTKVASLSIRLLDYIGGQMTFGSLHLTSSDTTPPAVAVDQPVAPALSATLGQSVSGTATDDLSGVKAVHVTFTDATGNATTVLAVCTACGTTNASWQAAAASVAPGLYNVTVTADDVAGNTSAPTPPLTVLVVP